MISEQRPAWADTTVHCSLWAYRSPSNNLSDNESNAHIPDHGLRALANYDVHHGSHALQDGFEPCEEMSGIGGEQEENGMHNVDARFPALKPLIHPIGEMPDSRQKNYGSRPENERAGNVTGIVEPEGNTHQADGQQ